jgi:1,4-alpha-glucan branching enzyme
MFQKATKKGNTTFSIAAPAGAKEVGVAGDFSSWKPLAMKKQPKTGRFAITVALQPGIYEYRYIIDGQWVTDPDHNHWAPNPFGSFNSVAQIQ